MNNEYRFSLQKYHPGSKGACPGCGRRACFVHYIDNDGTVVFPDYVGRCDHEQSCGYHYTPRDYFGEHPTEWTGPASAKDKTTSPAPIAPSYIDSGIMRRSMANYDINPLYHFFCDRFGKDETARLFRQYNVGTSRQWGGAVVYWQVDMKGRVHAGKVMGYDRATGHRIKEPAPQVSWAHSLLGLNDFCLRQCLFGEHLLAAGKTGTVFLVESEKTAIIAAHFIPYYIWLATGGKHGCMNSDAMRVLDGRDVRLMPDLGATEQWEAKAKLLSRHCRSVAVSLAVENNASEYDRENGADIADLLLREDTRGKILADFIQHNPAVQTLIDKFGLELVE